MKILDKYFPLLLNLKLSPRLKLIVVILAGSAIAIQSLRVFLSAYPVMSTGHLPGSSFPVDFGSYYTSAWRLIHNPGQMYTDGFLKGDPYLGASGAEFKYLPFFSFFMLPLLPLGYVTGLLVWNIFQFILLPVAAALLYKVMKSFNVVVIVGVLWIVLLQPLPYPPTYTVTLAHLYRGTQSYYWQWIEGQAKVFMTFLIVATYYLSKRRRPHLGGIAYGLAFFDPRFPLYSIPLVLMVNRGQYRRFSIAAIGTLAACNALLLYGGIASSFLGMVESSGLTTGFFPFSWIPFYTIAALTAVEGVALLDRIRRQRGSLSDVLSLIRFRQ